MTIQSEERYALVTLDELGGEEEVLSGEGCGELTTNELSLPDDSKRRLLLAGNVGAL